jgi:hypothetical protein
MQRQNTTEGFMYLQIRSESAKPIIEALEKLLNQPEVAPFNAQFNRDGECLTASFIELTDDAT